MEWLVCVAAVVLFVQGALVWGKRRLERHVRDFGILTACVAALTLAAYLLFTDGMFVFSREFGYFLVGGEGARIWLSLLLVATAVVAGLGWRIARIEAGGELTFPWYLTTGLVVGALSVAGIEQVRGDEGLLPALPLHYYDVWSCPLVLWLGACLAGALLSVLRWQKKIELRRLGGRSVDAVHVCGIAAAAVILAFAAVAERSGVFDDGVGLWNAVLFVASPLSIAAARLASHGTPTVRWPIVLYLAAGLVPAWIAYDVPAPALTFGLPSWAVAMLVALRSLRSLLMDKLFGRSIEARSNPAADRRKSSRPLVAFLILLVASSLGAAVLGFGNVDIAVTITLFFVGWAVLSDLLWEDGLFVRISRLAREPAKIVHACTTVTGAAGTAFGTAIARIEKALSADSWYGAAFKVFLGVVLIIGLAELPNAGRTIIMPFSVSSEIGDAEVGTQLSNRVVHELKMLATDLSRDITLTFDSNTQPSLYTHELSRAEEALAKSGSIELPGGLKLPVELLAWPIQKPARWLFNVNVITGSLVRNDTGYAVIATSSREDGWDAFYTPPDMAPDARDDETTAAPPSMSAEAMEHIAKRLAFEILLNSRDSGFERVTRDWEAWSAYAEGTDFLNRYLLQDARAYQHENLKRAIEKLRSAALSDPTSALTHYRLGLALQADGQVFPARDAFERSLEADPEFVAAKVALAVLRPGPPLLTLSLPPGAVERSLAPDNTARADYLWVEVIEDPNSSERDLATAFNALASSGFETLRAIRWAPGDAGQNAAHQAAALSAYYYAKRALKSYEALRSGAKLSLSTLQSHAYALNLLGVVVELVAAETRPITPLSWTCYHGAPEEPVDAWTTGAYAADAIGYYRASAELLPDDPVIRCNAASAAVALGDPGPMQELMGVAAVRKYAGDQIVEPDTLALLNRKLTEYQAAIDIDPSDTASLNTFAYSFYDFRRDHPQVGDDGVHLLQLGLLAERHAREAVRIGKLARAPEALFYESTLGEVLLAMHRYEEAARIFEGLEIPDHPTFFEVKWDLAQAYSCIAQANGDTVYLARAQQILSDIRKRDQGLFVPLFGQAPLALDALNTHGLCIGGPGYSLLEDNGLDIAFEVTEEAYSRMEPCDRNVLRVWAPEPEALAVQVWGEGGVYNYEVVPPDTHTVYTVLSWEPRDSKGKYFVRLYERPDPEGTYNAVSSIKIVDTFADCDRNAVDVWFERLVPQTPANE